MKTSNISRVAVEIPNTKKAKFNLSHDVNTTYDWGSVQPLFGKLMLPDSSINVNLEQLTRLAPMVVPTFGRVKLKNIAHFIPIQEIWPNWEALLSQTKVSNTSSGTYGPEATTFVPKTVPHVPQNILACMCLAGAKVNVYFSGDVGTVQENSWFCARNTGSYGTPAGWPAATAAVREFLNQVLDIKDTATPAPASIPDFNYYGYTYTIRRLPLNYNNRMILTANDAPVGRLPAISTLLCTPLANANGSGYTHSAGNERNTYDLTFGDEHVSFDGSDMIWEYRGDDGVAIASTDRGTAIDLPLRNLVTSFFDGKKIRVVFKLSSFGKRLRKVLIGLGYDVNLQNSDSVSLLPLVAFYKAWWDSYAPQRYMNFYETPCWKMIQASIQTSNSTQFLNAFNSLPSNPITEYFRQFIADLGTCFATEKMDVISAATDKYYGQTNTTTDSSSGITDIESRISTLTRELINIGSYNTTAGAVNSDGSLNTAIMPGSAATVQNLSNQLGLLLNTNNTNQYAQISQPMLDALKSSYVMINKTSVAGMDLEQILRVLGFGDYVEQCKGKFINASASPIKISDVVATAATSEAKLGQYGGRGLGVDGFQFSFNAKNHGYLIVLSSIVPESGYINAPSVENEAISFEKLYNPEFDGLAFEAIQKKNLVGSPLIGDRYYRLTFGFLPTYTQWKFMSNKANGDFSLNSRKNSMMPYTLDKYLPIDEPSVYRVEEANGHAGSTCELCSPPFDYSHLPTAGEDWRYINKFPWNGNYNRIFNAEDDGLEWSVFSPNNNAFLYCSFEYDNFMCHNVFTVTYWAHMKPIEDSYGTYDSEHSAPSTAITKQ